MEQYIYGLGMLMEDVRITNKGRIYLLVEGTDESGQFVFEKFDLPEVYQNFENVAKLKELTS